MNKKGTQGLIVSDLHIKTDNTEIVSGVSLEIKPGELHVLMGPNGSGKSTLANALAGHPKFSVQAGQIFLDGKEITNMSPDKRAKLGLFYSQQTPPSIPGVSVANVLRLARNAVKTNKLSVTEFFTLLKQKMADLEMDPAFAQRDLNEGFSGGERKRAEMLQMLVLEPHYAVLDETDSGLDVDALKLIAKAITTLKQSQNTGFLLITHHKRFLEYVNPDVIHVMKQGKIIASGGPELAEKIEKNGYENL